LQGLGIDFSVDINRARTCKVVSSVEEDE